MESRQNFIIAPRVVLGLAIIAAGVLFLLGNMDIINPNEYLRFWPSLLIIIGILYLVQCGNGSGRIWGIFLIVAGTIMLLDRFYLINFHVWDYWPLILVFVGIMMILRASSHHRDHATAVSERNSDSFIKAMAVIGGFRRSNNSQDFKGGELTAIMGGLEIDLRNASIKGEAIIDIFTLMGGVEMRVPDDWRVSVQGFPFLGGYEDKTRPPKESSKLLIVRGTVVMGGVEIKN
jgi:predicted membrane protein